VNAENNEFVKAGTVLVERDPGLPQWLNESRSVNWVRRFEAKGFAGLTEGPRTERPRRLSEAQLWEVDRALRQTPRELGLTGTL
jgi:hypothetical protein